jgi:hypothetical protein
LRMTMLNTDDLLKLIGEKEVQIRILELRIGALLQEKKAEQEKKEDADANG